MLGTLSMLPSAISYYDGFFVFPTQVLAQCDAIRRPRRHDGFVEGQKLDAYTPFEDLSRSRRTSSGSSSSPADSSTTSQAQSDPKAFVYAFDGNAFPNVPLIQPRLGSVEEWNFINNNNDEHPIHIHVNDFQVMQLSRSRRPVSRPGRKCGA